MGGGDTGSVGEELNSTAGGAGSGVAIERVRADRRTHGPALLCAEAHPAHGIIVGRDPADHIRASSADLAQQGEDRPDRRQEGVGPASHPDVRQTVAVTVAPLLTPGAIGASTEQEVAVPAALVGESEAVQSSEVPGQVAGRVARRGRRLSGFQRLRVQRDRARLELAQLQELSEARQQSAQGEELQGLAPQADFQAALRSTECLGVLRQLPASVQLVLRELGRGFITVIE